MDKANHTNVLEGSPELRDRLPKGAISRLAEKYDVSWTWIYNVVSGKVAGDDNIISDAIRLAAIEDETKTKIKTVI